MDFFIFWICAVFLGFVGFLGLMRGMGYAGGGWTGDLVMGLVC